MISPDTPESQRELDLQLDQDDLVLLESDRNRKSGTLIDLTRMLIRSINPKKFDDKFLHDPRINSEPEENEIDENEDRDCVLAYMKARAEAV